MRKEVDKIRTIAIVQARYGSSRLPGKVLLDLAGEPVLVRVIERVKRARLLDSFIVATTTETEADKIRALCRERGYPVYSGELHDVLDRFYQAARKTKADLIVRITADCPIIDPDLIDETISIVHSSYGDPKKRIDFAATRLPPPFQRTYPIGLDVEVCTFHTLERAWKEADQPFQREHVMPYLYEGVELAAHSLHLATGLSPRGFNITVLNHDPDYGSFRWAVDTVEDLELLRQVYNHFGGYDNFSWKEIITLFRQKPELVKINASVKHKTMLDSETDAH